MRVNLLRAFVKQLCYTGRISSTRMSGCFFYECWSTFLQRHPERSRGIWPDFSATLRSGRNDGKGQKCWSTLLGQKNVGQHGQHSHRHCEEAEPTRQSMDCFAPLAMTMGYQFVPRFFECRKCWSTFPSAIKNATNELMDLIPQTNY
jgi:hypothetical protein